MIYFIGFTEKQAEATRKFATLSSELRETLQDAQDFAGNFLYRLLNIEIDAAKVSSKFRLRVIINLFPQHISHLRYMAWNPIDQLCFILLQ